jgi:hypothetical protein
MAIVAPSEDVEPARESTLRSLGLPGEVSIRPVVRWSEPRRSPRRQDGGIRQVRLLQTVLAEEESPMKYTLLLPLMVILLSCNSITGLGASPTEGGVDYDAPADPINVTVVLNGDDSVRGVISPEGGELDFTSMDGSRYLLQVPPGALDAETEIEMTSVESLEGIPLTGPVFAVQLEPSGLIFNKLATLSIVPSTTIPIQDQLIFGYEGSGTDFHRALIDPETSEIRIQVTGFSGYGVTTADLANWRMGGAQARSYELKVTIAAMQHAQRQSRLTDSEARKGIDKALDDYERDVLGPARIAATEDCKTYGKYEELRRTYEQLAGLGSEDRLSGLAPGAETKKKLDTCRTFRANGTWATSSLEGIVKLGERFTLKIGGDCPGTMEFGGGLSGGVFMNCSYRGIAFEGSGSYGIQLTESGGILRGSSTFFGPGVRGDAAEAAPFYVTLVRIAP